MFFWFAKTLIDKETRRAAMKNYSVFFLKRKILEKPALLELIPKSLKIF